MKKWIYSIFMLLFIFTLYGCSFTYEEELVIESIKTVLLDDGRTMIMISYTDEEIEPTLVYIKKATKGENGNGIEEIKCTYSEDGLTTNLEFIFTDTTSQSVTVEVPNGRKIVGFKQEDNKEEGITNIYLQFNDGTYSEPLPILRGKDGEDGENGLDGSIFSELVIEENYDGSKNLTFVFSDGTEGECIVSGPIKGNSIKQITKYSSSKYYYLFIEYTNKEEGDLIELEIPVVNTWHNGAGKPSYYLGNNGDYYLDTTNLVIYAKENNIWYDIIHMDETKEDANTHSVKFDLNAEDAYLKDGYYYTSFNDIKEGTHFYGNGLEIPVPERPGYTFGGWYTSKNPTNSSAFTELTPIFSDTKLYAYWILD